MKLTPADLAVLAAYLIGMLAMGWYFSRKNTSTEEYFVGGRTFSGWVIGLSLVGTSISSITFLAYPADAYKTAWLRFLPNLMLPLAVFIAAYLFLPFFRRKNITSAYQYLEDRFGPSVRVYGALTFIVAQLVRISTILYLLALLIHEISGFDIFWCIALMGVFVSVYTIMGGIDAVIWTDVIQTVVLVIGGLLCLWVIVDLLPGGLGQIFSVAIQDGKFAFAELRDQQLVPVSWDLTLASKSATMMLVLGMTAWLTEFSSNQNAVQRYCAAKSTHEARKGMFVCAFSSLPIWAFYMFLGTALYVFYQVYPTLDAQQMLSGEQKAEQILPYFIMNQLPQGIVGLVIAAALAAAMSSLDSSINAISTVGIVDIYRRHLVKEKPDQHYLRAAWLIATLAAFFMILGAVLICQADTKTLQDMAIILVSVLSGGLLGLYLIGFFTQRGDAKAVWVGIATTMSFTLWAILDSRNLLPEAAHLPFDLYYTAIIGNLLMFVVTYLVAILLFKRKEDSSRLAGLTVWS